MIRKDYTLQQAYNRMKAYFSQPGAVLAKYSEYEEGEGGSTECLYRTPEGNSCAVGCLIPEGLYRPYFESRTLDTLLRDLRALSDGDEAAYNEMLASAGVWDDDSIYVIEDEFENARRVVNLLDDDKQKVEFLSKAQNLHDREAIDAPSFVKRLEALAQEYGLKV